MSSREEKDNDVNERREGVRIFMARRGVVWPKSAHTPVRLRNLYPDLSEFYVEDFTCWHVKLKNLYPDLSEFY